MTVLIVDDAEIIRNIAKTELEKNSIRTKVASNGFEALEIIDKENISLIFLDIHMPEKNGIEFLKQLNKEDIKIPCIVVSTESNIEFSNECKKLGAIGWLSKPVEKDIFVKIYKKLIDKTKVT